MVPTDGTDVPAPTFTVVNFKPETNLSYYKTMIQKCIEEHKNYSCIENLGESPEEIFQQQFSWGEHPPMRWKKKFNSFEGWHYVRKGIMDMNQSKDYPYDSIMAEFKKQSLKFQIRIHDTNDYVMDYNSIPIVDLKNFSIAVYVNIKRRKMVKGCNDDKDYSFNVCVEKFVSMVPKKIKIQGYLFQSINIYYYRSQDVMLHGMKI